MSPYLAREEFELLVVSVGAPTISGTFTSRRTKESSEVLSLGDPRFPALSSTVMLNAAVLPPPPPPGC
ncbi:MAG: hypothetical protein QGF03_05100, partial [SAR324 cluster bacterium]|nr:hypothetical protein [SAR324 cluster bacterium]